VSRGFTLPYYKYTPAKPLNRTTNEEDAKDQSSRLLQQHWQAHLDKTPNLGSKIHDQRTKFSNIQYLRPPSYTFPTSVEIPNVADGTIGTVGRVFLSSEYRLQPADYGPPKGGTQNEWMAPRRVPSFSSLPPGVNVPRIFLKSLFPKEMRRFPFGVNNPSSRTFMFKDENMVRHRQLFERKIIFLFLLTVGFAADAFGQPSIAADVHPSGTNRQTRWMRFLLSGIKRICRDAWLPVITNLS
jgi:hypothetical protein